MRVFFFILAILILFGTFLVPVNGDFSTDNSNVYRFITIDDDPIYDDETVVTNDTFYDLALFYGWNNDTRTINNLTGISKLFIHDFSVIISNLTWNGTYLRVTDSNSIEITNVTFYNVDISVLHTRIVTMSSSDLFYENKTTSNRFSLRHIDFIYINHCSFGYGLDDLTISHAISVEFTNNNIGTDGLLESSLLWIQFSYISELLIHNSNFEKSYTLNIGDLKSLDFTENILIYPYENSYYKANIFLYNIASIYKFEKNNINKGYFHVNSLKGFVLHDNIVNDSIIEVRDTYGAYLINNTFNYTWGEFHNIYKVQIEGNTFLNNEHPFEFWDVSKRTITANFDFTIRDEDYEVNYDPFIFGILVISNVGIGFLYFRKKRG